MLLRISLSKEILLSLSKDTLMFIFAMIKRPSDIYNDTLAPCLVDYLSHFKDQEGILIKILTMVTEGLKQITVKSCKKVEKNLNVIEKIVNMIQHLSSELLSRKITKEDDELWASNLFQILAKLRENGSVKAIDSLYNK